MHLPSLLGLKFLPESPDADWLRASLTTFGQNVASVVPGHFEAYAFVYHPFEVYDGTRGPFPTLSWREVTAAAGVSMDDAVRKVNFNFLPKGEGEHYLLSVGSMPMAMMEPLLEHLRQTTATPDRCFFAVWEGWGDLPSPLAAVFDENGNPAPGYLPLELPYRRYHVFTGAIEDARTSFSEKRWVEEYRSANLWWPADQSWCVATEVDFAWTYVGGSRSCIEALLADPRLEAVETHAAATLPQGTW